MQSTAVATKRMSLDLARTSLIFLGLLGLAFLPRPAAAADACGVTLAPKVTVQLDAPPPGHDNGLTIAELNKRAPPSHRPELAGYDYALGFTEVVLSAEAEAATVTKPSPAGGFCTSVTTTTVHLHWRTTVRIAQELKPGTCIERMVEIHEAGHVAVDRKLEPSLTAELVQAVAAASQGSVRGSTVEGTRSTLQRRIAAALNAGLDALVARRDQHQRALDTPEEYSKVPQACGADALNRVLGR